MTAATWALKVDWDKDGSYTDETAYWDGEGNGFSIDRPVSDAESGAHGASTCSFALRNVDGRYNRNYSGSVIYGRPIDRIPVKIEATHSAATTVFWQGYIIQMDGPDYQPVGGDDYSFAVFTATDTLGVLIPDDVTIGVATTYDTDGALAAVADAVGITSSDRTLSDGVQDIPIYFTTKERAGKALVDIVASEMGGFLLTDDKDASTAGKLRFQSRTDRLGITSPRTWGQGTNIRPVRVKPFSPQPIATKCDVSVLQYQVGSGGVVIYDAGLGIRGFPFDNGAMTLGPNEQVGPIWIIPNQQGVSAWSGALTCTAGIDYIANQNVDGSGTDRTSEISVVLTQPAGGGGYYTIINTSASNTSYLLRFVIRAVAVTDGAGNVPGVLTYEGPTGADDSSIGTVAWTGPSNIAASENTYTTAVLTAGQSSHYLTAKAWNAAIPGGADVTGVRFEVEGKTSSGSQALKARIIVGGTIKTARTLSGTLTTTEAYVPIGGPTELWDQDLTPTIVNASDFGVALYLDTAGAATYSIDHVKMVVYYRTVSGIQQATRTYSLEVPDTALKSGAKIERVLPWVSDDNLGRDFGMQELRKARYPSEWLELTFIWGGKTSTIDDAVIDEMIAIERGMLVYYDDTDVDPSRSAYAKDYYRIEGIGDRHEIGSRTATIVTLRPAYDYRNVDAIAWDDFNRADAATLGTTPTGDTWSVDFGSWGITSGKALPTGGSSIIPDQLYFDLGKSDFIIEMQLRNNNSDTNQIIGFMFRRTDSSHYWYWIVDKAANLLILGLSNGAALTTWTYAFTCPDDVDLRLIAQGSRIRGYANRKLYADVTDSTLSSGTYTGMYSKRTTTVQVTNFYVQGLKL